MLSLSVSSQNERDTHVDVLLVSLSGAAHPRVCSLLSLPAGHQACVYPFRSWREMRSEASKNRRYRLGWPPLGDNEEAWVVYTLCVCSSGRRIKIFYFSTKTTLLKYSRVLHSNRA